MNKKIYFNDCYIEFLQERSQVSQNQPIKFYELIGNYELPLITIVEEFIERQQSIQIITGRIDFSSVLSIFKKQFHYIEAAGGFIKKKKEFLCIHRHGRWDLPKGKLEKKETTREAAIRECEEECSVKNLKIIQALSPTFHIYSYKKNYALKQSYWYIMETDYEKKLVPQKEESIDEVRWFNREELELTVLQDTYYTIRDVINEALGQK